MQTKYIAMQRFDYDKELCNKCKHSSFYKRIHICLRKLYIKDYYKL